MTWDLWTVSKPCLVPMVVIRGENPAAGLCGGLRDEGDNSVLRAHHLPLAAGESKNLSGPMATREPVSVSARVEPAKQTRCGFSKVFALSCVVSGLHGQRQPQDETQHAQRKSAFGARSYE